eukprot:Phypoly_transcript_07670.p1 GENE.Phypoly_transcript_07670~~Phypoly_transcript_07670.p1  ORF type:complete len:417 (+),score=48.89 Phypoly_transcript_07670:280-1530(+)
MHIMGLLQILVSLAANTSGNLIANEATLKAVSSIYPILQSNKQLVQFLGPFIIMLLGNIARDSTTIPKILQFCPNVLNFTMLLMESAKSSYDGESIPVQLMRNLFMGTAGKELIDQSKREIFVTLLNYFKILTTQIAILQAHETVQTVLHSSNENAKKVFVSKEFIALVDKHVTIIKDGTVLSKIQATISEMLLQRMKLGKDLIQDLKAVVLKMESSPFPNIAQYSKLLLDKLNSFADDPGNTVSDPKCSNPTCQVKGNLKRCGGCKQTSYCSQQCQKQDWVNGHKAACPILKAKFSSENFLLFPGKRATTIDNNAALKFVDESWNEIATKAVLNGITDITNTVVLKNFQTGDLQVIPIEHFFSTTIKSPPFNGERQIGLEAHRKTLENLGAPGYLVVIIHPSTVAGYVIQLKKNI